MSEAARVRHEEAAKRDGITLTGEWRGSSIPMEAICPKGHRISIRPNNIVQGHRWCKFCGAEKVAIGARIPLDEALRLVAEHCPTFQPTREFPGTHEPWIGVCRACGSNVKPRLSALMEGRGCCPKCRKGGSI